MTINSPNTIPGPDVDASGRAGTLTRVGATAALVAAGTFGYGIVMFATTLSEYTDSDATPAESVDFLVDHQGSLLAWYIGIFIVFGAALVPMGLALRQRLASAAPLLANTGMVVAAIWAALMSATGMISNIGSEAVADLAESDSERAVTVWSTIDTVTNGLGGGNELVGGIWILLVSVAGLLTARLPRWLNLVGVVTAVAGLLTVVPDFESVEMVFGLGSIVWFVGIGVSLLGDRDTREATSCPPHWSTSTRPDRSRRLRGSCRIGCRGDRRRSPGRRRSSNRCSRRRGADDGNRTRVLSLGS